MTHRKGGRPSRRFFVVGENFAFQFSVNYTTHFSDFDVCSTVCAIVFAEKV